MVFNVGEVSDEDYDPNISEYEEDEEIAEPLTSEEEAEFTDIENSDAQSDSNKETDETDATELYYGSINGISFINQSLFDDALSCFIEASMSGRFYHCKECKHDFGQKKKFLRHSCVKLVFNCDQCSKSYCRKDDLLKHKNKKH